MIFAFACRAVRVPGLAEAKGGFWGGRSSRRYETRGRGLRHRSLDANQ